MIINIIIYVYNIYIVIFDEAFVNMAMVRNFEVVLERTQNHYVNV
jgi:hypothetical protein